MDLHFGLAAWIAQAQAGSSLQALAEQYASSSAFVATYGALNNRAYVRQLYLNLLGREPDTAGWNDWTGRLDRGEATRGALLAGFSESQEFLAANDNDTKVVLAYLGLLRRVPDAAGFTNWLAALDGGAGYGALLDAIASSLEYRRRFLP